MRSDHDKLADAIAALRRIDQWLEGWIVATDRIAADLELSGDYKEAEGYRGEAQQFRDERSNVLRILKSSTR